MKHLLAAIVILIGAMAASPVLADYEDGVFTLPHLTAACETVWPPF